MNAREKEIAEILEHQGYAVYHVSIDCPDWKMMHKEERIGGITVKFTYRLHRVKTSLGDAWAYITE